MATYAIIARHDEAGLVQWLTVTDRSNRVGYEKSRQALGDLQAKATRVAFDAMHDTFFNHLSDLQFVVIEDDPRADPFADFQSLQDDDWEACYDDFAADQYETRSTFNWHSRWISQQQRDLLELWQHWQPRADAYAYAYLGGNEDEWR